MADQWIGRNDPQWVPDNLIANCMGCGAKFSLLVRKHHCRTCGRIFCDTCSSNFLQGKRVCNECAAPAAPNVTPAQGQAGGSDRWWSGHPAQNERPRDLTARVGQALSGQSTSRGSQQPVPMQEPSEAPRDMGSHAAQQRASAEQRLARRLAGIPADMPSAEESVVANPGSPTARSSAQYSGTSAESTASRVTITRINTGRGGSSAQHQPSQQQHRDQLREYRETPSSPSGLRAGQSPQQAYVAVNVAQQRHQQLQQNAPPGGAMQAYRQAQERQEQAHRGILHGYQRGDPAMQMTAAMNGSPAHLMRGGNPMFQHARLAASEAFHAQEAIRASEASEARRQQQAEAQRAAAGRVIAGHFPTHTVSQEELNHAADLERSWRETGCVICMEGFRVGDTRKTLPCFHYFHEECLDNWIQRKPECPTCKLRLDQPNQDGPPPHT